MTDKTCGACEQPIRDQLAICHRCEQVARRLLAQQASLHAELLTEYRREAKKTEQLQIRHGGEPPTLFEEKAARLLTRQVSWLAGWAATAARLRPAVPQPGPLCRSLRCPHKSCRTIRDTRPPERTVDGHALYVASTLPLMRRLPEGATLANEVRRLTAEIVAAIDTPEMLTRITAGPCPELDQDGDPCAGTVEAFVRRDTPATMRCGTCKTVWDSTQWTRAGHRILARRDQITRQRTLARQFAKGAAA